MSLLSDLDALPEDELRARLRELSDEQLLEVLWGEGDPGLLACGVSKLALEERIRRAEPHLSTRLDTR